MPASTMSVFWLTRRLLPRTVLQRLAGAAEVLTVTDSLPSTLPAPVQDPLLIAGTGFTASRREALRVSLLAVPCSETLCWRPPLLPRPKVTGTMTARVTSAKANDIYAPGKDAVRPVPGEDLTLTEMRKGRGRKACRCVSPNPTAATCTAFTSR